MQLIAQDKDKSRWYASSQMSIERPHRRMRMIDRAEVGAVYLTLHLLT
jgi:hypothetical protein